MAFWLRVFDRHHLDVPKDSRNRLSQINWQHQNSHMRFVKVFRIFSEELTFASRKTLAIANPSNHILVHCDSVDKDISVLFLSWPRLIRQRLFNAQNIAKQLTVFSCGFSEINVANRLSSFFSCRKFSKMFSCLSFISWFFLVAKRSPTLLTPQNTSNKTRWKLEQNKSLKEKQNAHDYMRETQREIFAFMANRVIRLTLIYRLSCHRIVLLSFCHFKF